MEVFDPNNVHLIKEKVGLDYDMVKLQDSLLNPLSLTSQGPRNANLKPMKMDTEYNDRLLLDNLGGRSVQSTISPHMLQTMEFKGEHALEVKEGYHSRIPTTNVNDYMEGSLTERSRNID